MIDLQNEHLIPIAQVPKTLPSRATGKRIHISAVYRWVQRGVRGRRLEAIQIGGTTYTSQEALQRFGSSRGDEPAALVVTTARRQHQIDRANRRVAEILRGSRPEDN